MTTRPGSASTARRRDGAVEAFMTGILRRFFDPDDIRRKGGPENVVVSRDRLAKPDAGDGTPSDHLHQLAVAFSDQVAGSPAMHCRAWLAPTQMEDCVE